MFLEYYGLREQPFGVTPNPRYLYHSAMHREALASLIYGIESDLGFAALIADPGMGKTTLLFYLLEKFRNTARTALIFQTLCTPLELLRYLANELEIQTKETDVVSLNERIKDVLVQEARAKRRVIVIIDEAQNLDEPVLETVRLLSDFETQNTKLMHIILAGQLQLAEKLARPGMAQLLQRVSMLNRLGALNVEETKNYVEYRLGVAGYRGAPLFSSDAIKLLAEMSGGVPRKINRICFNALSLGCAVGKRTIDEQVIREVGSDLDIGDLLFQKGAITDEPDAHSVTRVESMPISAQRSEVAEIRKAEPVALERKAIGIAEPVASVQTSPAVSAQPVIQESGTSVPRLGATTVSGHVRPFVAPVAPVAGIARPLASVQTKPAPVSTVRSAAVTRTPKPELVRTNSPAKTSRFAILASSGLLCGVLAFAGWTLWGNVGNRGVVARATSVPQTSGQEVDLPVSEKLAENVAIDQAIERGRSSAAASTKDVTRPSSGTVNNQPLRHVAEVRDATSRLRPQIEPKRGDRAISAALIRKVQPVYPAEARRSGIQGSVTVSAVIGIDGKPRNVRTVSGDPLLAKAATEAVSQWLYQPYVVNGRRVEVETEVVVDFALR